MKRTIPNFTYKTLMGYETYSQETKPANDSLRPINAILIFDGRKEDKTPDISHLEKELQRKIWRKYRR